LFETTPSAPSAMRRAKNPIVPRAAVVRDRRADLESPDGNRVVDRKDFERPGVLQIDLVLRFTCDVIEES